MNIYSVSSVDFVRLLLNSPKARLASEHGRQRTSDIFGGPPMISFFLLPTPPYSLSLRSFRPLPYSPYTLSLSLPFNPVRVSRAAVKAPPAGPPITHFGSLRGKIEALQRTDFLKF